MFYFIRHGEADYSERDTKIYQGFGTQLCPLTRLGVEQIEAAAQNPRLADADLILTSPYTRAVQTAAILSRALGAGIAVETDLHEWLANKNYVYESHETAAQSHAEYTASGGVYPPSEDRPWESAELVRARYLRVLERYRDLRKVIVACHGMAIQAVTGSHHPQNGEIVGFEL